MHSSQTNTQGIHHSPTNHITSPAECQQLWQAMKIPFSETVSSDPKISAMHFRAELARLGLVPQATHHFLDAMDVVRGGTICNHHQAVCVPKICRVRGPSTIASPSCSLRESPVIAHGDDLSVVGLPGDTEQTTLRVISALLSLQPRTFLVESITGLTEADHISGALSEDYHIAIIDMALELWVEAERSRPAPHSLTIDQSGARERCGAGS